MPLNIITITGLSSVNRGTSPSIVIVTLINASQNIILIDAIHVIGCTRPCISETITPAGMLYNI